MSSFDQFSADELVEAGVWRERRLDEIEEELKTLAPAVAAEGRKLRNSAVKLSLTSGAAVAGAVAAPATGGWSLWAISLPVAGAVWEMKEFGTELKDLIPKRRRLRELRRESAALVSEIEEILKEMDSRP